MIGLVSKTIPKEFQKNSEVVKDLDAVFQLEPVGVERMVPIISQIPAGLPVKGVLGEALL